MTATPTLSDSYIARIFDRLLGKYGNGFLSKFSRIDEKGRDIGLLGAKEAWAEELAGFQDKPDAIAYAIRNLPPDFPPNAMQFAELCRAGAKHVKSNAPALAYTPDPEKSKAFAAKLAAMVSKGVQGSDPIFWATHPKGHQAFEFICGAAQSDPKRFQPCIDHLIAEGRVSQDGKHLLQKYIGGGAWVKA
jgi:hypothetical protein